MIFIQCERNIIIFFKINFMWKFEIYIDKAWEYRFILRAWNWQRILTSEWYSSQLGCENGIEAVRENSQMDDRFKRKDTHTWYMFEVLAWNRQVLWNSEVYSSVPALENGIESVIKNASEAEVVFFK